MGLTFRIKVGLFLTCDHDGDIVWNTLPVEGVTEFALSPGKNYSVAVFVAEKKVGALCVSFLVYSMYYPTKDSCDMDARVCRDLYTVLTTSL